MIICIIIELDRIGRTSCGEDVDQRAASDRTKADTPEGERKCVSRPPKKSETIPGQSKGRPPRSGLSLFSLSSLSLFTLTALSCLHRLLVLRFRVLVRIVVGTWAASCVFLRLYLPSKSGTTTQFCVRM